MTAKEYLSQAFILDRMMKAKQKQIQDLRDMQLNVSSVLSHTKAQPSGKKDRVGDLTSTLIDLIDEYADDVARLIDIKREIKSVIETVSNLTYRLILEERYVNLKRWEDVASDNNYSWQHIHKLHGRALEEIKEAIECDAKNVI